MIKKNLAAAALIACALFLPAGGPASAADAVPSPISNWFANSAIDFVISADAENHPIDESAKPEPYLSATSTSEPVEVFSWTDEFVSGASSALKFPVVSTREWQSALLNGNEVVGVVQAVYDASTKVVQPNGYGTDPDIAAAVMKVEAGAQLVLDQPSYGIYQLSNGRVTALNPTAAVEVPRTVSLEDFQQIIAKRYATSIEEAKPYGGAAVGGGGVRPLDNTTDIVTSISILVAGVGCLVVAALVVRGTRHRRTGQRRTKTG